MACIHIQRVKNLLDTSAIRNLMGNISLTCNSQFLVRGSCGCADCYEVGCQRKREILNILNECNCVETKEWEIQELKRKAGNLENNQLVLARDKSSFETSLIRVQTENSQLWNTNSSLQNQLIQKDRDIEWGKNQLALVQRSEREKQTKIDDLTRQLTTLQITNNSINREITEKKNEIENWKGDLNLSREEFLNQKIGLKEEKLEILIQQLGVNRAQVANLRNAYQQLINARTEFSQTNINVAKGNIENAKTALLNGRVNVANTQKICRKCEKLVKLEIELNQVYQQQYEARQEAPPR